MRLSPLIIKKQEFTKSLRGFDPEEVQAFLDKMASDVDLLLQENESLNEEVESLNQRVTEFQSIEKNLQDTLLKAQESSTKAIESSKKQTNLIIKEAEIKASQILESAKQEVNDIQNAVVNLREERDLIVAKLKAIVNSQAHLLESKVKDAGDEPVQPNKTETKENVDIDVDDIVNKLL
ncbi:MAG: DivIVA domain-containing protein [Ignavibacteriae bacterium]|nr:MAG: DivIVA domain-containing protein [Ignavibacteriota bacterium]